MDYEVRKVLDSDQRSAIVETLKDMEPTYYHQDYNLHDVKKWNAGINSNNIPQLKVVRDLFPDLAVHSQYFLEYGVDSFTKQHTDNDALIVKTVVTLIQSTDLVGGETIVLKTYHRKPRPSVAERKGAAQYGKRIIPDVVYMEDGEAIIYDRSLPHSVSQVKQGTRLVLVTWFMNKDK
tara:strand:+ start:1747 stop:2280 length:534 start_codon:yes stop_codon:yes gene_type:complete